MNALIRLTAVAAFLSLFTGCQPPQDFEGSYVNSGRIVWRIQTGDGVETYEYEPARESRITRSTTGDIELRMDGCALPFFLDDENPESATLAEATACYYAMGEGYRIGEAYSDATIAFTDEDRVSFEARGQIVDGYDGTAHGTFTVDVSLIRD